MDRDNGRCVSGGVRLTALWGPTAAGGWQPPSCRQSAPLGEPSGTEPTRPDIGPERKQIVAQVSGTTRRSPLTSHPPN